MGLVEGTLGGYSHPEVTFDKLLKSLGFSARGSSPLGSTKIIRNCRQAVPDQAIPAERENLGVSLPPYLTPAVARVTWRMMGRSPGSARS